ncbi:MAG: sigma-70 family RNA polymerase sigma factor [Chloroflexi bacterium]|nr:sigma-70 family RNA polymerase sigma factor [Chloroflexota bacterium]
MKHRKTKEGGPSPNTETTEWQQAQGGCRQSLNQLMSKHDGLVHAVVRQQVLGDLPYERALHTGRTGLWRAIMGYDRQRGTAFSTYAWIAIMRAIWAAVKKYHQGEERLPLSETITDEQQEPDRRWERKVIQASTQVAVAALPVRLQQGGYFRYGWEGQKPVTFREIGEQMGITKQRAHQLHQEALMRLRQPALSYQLRSLLDKQSPADYQVVASETAVWLQRRGGRR